MDRAAFERFHNDLKAALTANIPLHAGENTPLTISTLENLQQQLTVDPPGTPQPDTKPNNPTWNDKSLPKWYRSALTVFSETGSMLPVLEGLSVQPLAVRDAFRSLRWTLVYVLIVASIVVLGLSIYLFNVVPSIELMRNDIRVRETADFVPRFDILPFLPWVTLGLAIGLVAMWGWAMFGGLSDLALLLGGQNYVNFLMSATILRISRSLVRSGMEGRKAVSTACRLVSADQKLETRVQAIIHGTNDAVTFGQMSDCLRTSAFNQLVHLKFTTPFVVVASVGGGLTLLYCLTVYWPLLSILNDLPFSEP